MNGQKFVVCLDCGAEFATSDDARAHISKTLALTGSETGVIARSHETRTVNPTPEEQRP